MKTQAVAARKYVPLSAAALERVRDYRFSRRIDTEGEALQKLVEKGLDAVEAEGRTGDGATVS